MWERQTVLLFEARLPVPASFSHSQDRYGDGPAGKTLSTREDTITMSFKQITIVVIIVLALILVVQNTQVVSIDILFWEVSISRVLLIPLLLLLGAVIGYLGHWQMTRHFRTRRPDDMSRSDSEDSLR